MGSLKDRARRKIGPDGLPIFHGFRRHPVWKHMYLRLSDNTVWSAKGIGASPEDCRDAESGITPPVYQYAPGTMPYDRRRGNAITTSYQGEKVISLVYRFIYEALTGKVLPKGYHVHHIDGDPGNNSPDNLEALTPAEHAKHRKKKRAKK